MNGKKETSNFSADSLFEVIYDHFFQKEQFTSKPAFSSLLERGLL